MANVLGFKFQFENTRKSAQDVKSLDKAVGDLDETLDDTKKSAEKLKEEYQDSKKVLGDYLGEVRIGGVQLKTFTGILKTKKEALAASDKFLKFNIKSLKLFKVALASTGIGVLVIALGSLVTYLTQTQKGMDAVARITKQVRSVFDNFVESIAEFGGGLVAIFQGRFKEGISEIRNSFKGFGEEIREDLEQAKIIANEFAAIRDKQREIEVKTSEARRRIKELEFIADDRVNTSEAERAAAAQEAFEIEQNLLAERIALQERVIANVERENAISITTAEDEQKLADAQIVLEELKTESLERQLALRNKNNEITLEQQRIAEETAKNAKTALEQMEESLVEMEKVIASGELEGEDLKAKLIEIADLKGKIDQFNQSLQKTVSLTQLNIQQDQTGIGGAARRIEGSSDLVTPLLNLSDQEKEKEKENLDLIRDLRRENWNQMRQDALDAQQAMRDEEEFFANERFRIIDESFAGMSNSIEGFFNGQIKTFKEFNKALLGVLLDAIGKSVELILVEAAAKSFAQNPILGAFVFAGIRGIVQGLLGAAKAQVEQFEYGGVPDHGIIQGPSHAAGGVKIEVEGGEGVINKRSMASREVLNVTGTPYQIASAINSYRGYGKSFGEHRSAARRFQQGGIPGISAIPQFVTPSRIGVFEGSGSSGFSLVAEESIQRMSGAIATAVRQGISVGLGDASRRRAAEDVFFNNSQL